MERNITLDYFKLLLSILVITIHSSIGDSGLGGALLVKGVARLAVPCFLVINGYFIFNILDNSAKFKKHIWHIVLLFIVWSFVYVPIGTWVFASLKQMLIETATGGFWHLWYLYSLILASILLYLVKKVNSNVLLVIACVLYLTGYVLQKFEIFNIHTMIHPRNFLFMGFPFLFIGYYINKNKLDKKNINKSILFGSVFILFMLHMIETYISCKHELISTDFSLFLIILCPLLFLAVMKVSVYKEGDGYISKLASAIYFNHLMILFFVRSVFQVTDLYGFPLTLFFCFILGNSIILLNKKIKIFI